MHKANYGEERLGWWKYGVNVVFWIQCLPTDLNISTNVTRNNHNISLQDKIPHYLHSRIRQGNTTSASGGWHTNVSVISIGAGAVLRHKGENLLCLTTHSKVIADYYSLWFIQPPNQRSLRWLCLCGYDTPHQFWAPSRVKPRVEILRQLVEKCMVHQRQQRKCMCRQGKKIYLKLPLLQMIVSIRMTQKEVIWKSAPKIYFVGLSPLYTSIIRA